MILAALGLGGIIVLGCNGRPVAPTLRPTSPTESTAAGPTTSRPSESTAALPTAAASNPPTVIFAPYLVSGDQQISHCEHKYTVVFTITDGNGQSAIYAGKTAVFHLLDNEADRTAIVAADGTFQAEVDETFEKTGSGCFSHLQPKVLSVDGRPVF